MPDWLEDIDKDVPERLKERVRTKRVRYFLSRLKTEAEGLVEVGGLPEGFREFYESQEMFDGWENWGVTWDVGDPRKKSVPSDDYLEVIPLWTSLWEDWDEQIAANHKHNEIAARKRRRRMTADGSET